MTIQCSTYPDGYKRDVRGGGRCPNSAAHWLIQPDGKRNPGGYVCDAHGQAITSEYSEKLGEVWTLGPLELSR